MKFGAISTSANANPPETQIRYRIKHEDERRQLGIGASHSRDGRRRQQYKHRAEARHNPFPWRRSNSKFRFRSNVQQKNTSKFSASKLCLLVQSNGKSKPEKGTEVVLTTFLLSKLWWHLEPTKPRWRSTIHANYLSVLANHSLNRTHCSVPSFGL